MDLDRFFVFREEWRLMADLGFSPLGLCLCLKHCVYLKLVSYSQHVAGSKVTPARNIQGSWNSRVNRVLLYVEVGEHS
jgi:hypothetical protein